MARTKSPTGQRKQAASLPGTQQPVSFQPYLDRIRTVLNHQYFLALGARPGKNSGLQRVKLDTEIPDLELVSGVNVFVPAPSSLSKDKEE